MAPSLRDGLTTTTGTNRIRVPGVLGGSIVLVFVFLVRDSPFATDRPDID